MGHTTDKIVQTMSRALADEKLLTGGGISVHIMYLTKQINVNSVSKRNNFVKKRTECFTQSNSAFCSPLKM